MILMVRVVAASGAPGECNKEILQHGETTMAKAKDKNIPQTSDQDDVSGFENDLWAHGFADNEWISMIGDDPKKMPLSTKAICFHNCDAKRRAVRVNDARIYAYLTNTQHIITCGGVAYIYRNGYYNEDLDGTILQSMISDCILEDFDTSTTVSRVHKKFFQKKELVRYLEDMNAYSPWYINFQNGMYDVKRQVMFSHSPKTLSINQIPHVYDPKAHYSGNEIEKFLRFSIPDEDDRRMLLEYIGLCMTTDTSQQKMLVIQGEGGTGKSTLINLIQDVVGKRNISNVSLTELQQRFKPILMMGKLLNTCADLEIDALDDVSMVKKLIGEDNIDGEHKGLKPVSFRNYAKLLFSTNELPLVRNEKTKGFFRRLLVLAMNKEPETQDKNLKEKLRNEIPYLIHISIEALRDMYMREGASITVSENSKAATRQLRLDSDSVEAFLSERCKLTNDSNDKMSRNDVYEEYKDYCEQEERQAHSKNNLFKALRNKKVWEFRSSKDRYFIGIRIRNENDDDVDEKGFIKIPENVEDLGVPSEWN